MSLKIRPRRWLAAPLLLCALPALAAHHHHHHRQATPARPAAPSAAASVSAPPATDLALNPETQLLSAVQSLRDGDSQSALSQLRELVQREPNFHLAQLLYGQVLAERSGVGGAGPLGDEQDPKVRDLLAEYQVRLAEAENAPPLDALPSSILSLSPSHRYAVVADLPRSRLYVLDNSGGKLRTIRDLYVSIARNGYGKQNTGDLRTPVGIYRVVSFTPGGRLPPFYGAGAYPLNYPNSWDRVHGRTGNGIWLHGVPPDTYARPPRASEGCVVLANSDLVDLKALIVPGVTPVVLSDKVEWLLPQQTEQRRDELSKRIESWRARWSALDTEAYLGYYADDFHTDDGMNLKNFGIFKRRVNQSKRHIDVQLADLDLFTYPGEPDLVLAEFTQNYRSDNFAKSSRKEQYWRRQADGSWKIVREENRTL